MAVLFICKNEEDTIKNEGSRLLAANKIFPIKLFEVYGNFFKHSRAANSAVLGRIGLKFKLVLDFKVVPPACKNEEDPIKNEGARVLTKLYILFQPLKGS